MEEFKTKYTKNILLKDKSYKFFLKNSIDNNNNNDNDIIEFKLEKELDVNFHKVNINYNEFKISHPILKNMKKNKFLHFIIESMEMKEYEIIDENNNNKKIINYWIDIGKGKYSERYNFSIFLEKKIKDISINIGNIS